MKLSTGSEENDGKSYGMPHTVQGSWIVCH